MKLIFRSRLLDPAVFEMRFPARIVIQGCLCVGLVLAPGFPVLGAVHVERGTECRQFNRTLVCENEDAFFAGGTGSLRALAPGSESESLL